MLNKEGEVQTVDLQITGASLSKIATGIIMAVIGSIIGLLSWNVYTTHTLSSDFIGLYTNQGTVISQLEKVTDSSTIVQNQIISLSAKVDRIDMKMMDLSESDRVQNSLINELRIDSAKRGGPEDPVQREVNLLRDRINNLEKK